MNRSYRYAVRAFLSYAASFLCFFILSDTSALADVAAVSPKRNAPDAFLPLPASNIESVLEQVHSDPAVRRHYARYFHMPQSRVASYLRANLVPSRLRQGGLFTVYYVRANGLIYPTLLKVPSGSPVFALRNGPPVLTWKEGNPLARTRKAVPLGVKSVPPPIPVSVDPPPPLQIIVPTQVQTTIIPPLKPPPPTDSVPDKSSSSDNQ